VSAAPRDELAPAEVAPAPVALWHGTVGLFARAGFEATGRSTPGRAVMTLHAAP
jgi:hypothetical protein